MNLSDLALPPFCARGALSLPIGKGAAAFSTTLTPGGFPDALAGRPLILPGQTHTARVAVVTTPAPGPLPDTDALVTSLPGVAIGVRTADCLPIILCDAEARVVGAVHAGWRGTLGGILPAALRAMTELGAEMSRIIICAGPAICADCYEISPGLADRFREAGLGEAVSYIPGLPRPHLDLLRGNLIAAAREGFVAQEGNVRQCGLCTMHARQPHGERPFPSWRREHSTLRRLVTFVSLDE